MCSVKVPSAKVVTYHLRHNMEYLGAVTYLDQGVTQSVTSSTVCKQLLHQDKRFYPSHGIQIKLGWFYYLRDHLCGSDQERVYYSMVMLLE